jgi:uncharacterized protein YjbI with pentapeptide repeats
MEQGFDIFVGMQVSQQKDAMLEKLLGHRMLHAERRLANRGCQRSYLSNSSPTSLPCNEYASILRAGNTRREPVSNQEHVDRLREGITSWNRWRRRNRDVRPDLSHADLIQVNLSYANLREVNLESADLLAVNLHGGDLFRANLSHADLCYASLIEAVLQGADLTGAFVLATNFQCADLRNIPWLLIMELTLHQDTNFAGIQ